MRKSLRAERRVKKYSGLSEDLIRNGNDANNDLVEQLSSIGDIKIIELFLDTTAGIANLPTSHFRSFYDATGITESYLDILERSNSWEKRAFAAEKLGLIGSVKSVPLLLSVTRNVKDEDEDVRGASLRALGRIRDESAIPFLIEALGSPETWLPPAFAKYS